MDLMFFDDKTIFDKRIRFEINYGTDILTYDV
jgi:hypothetical protein